MTSQLCSGCTACASVCPRQAITFEADQEGFMIPHIIESKCINCGLCLKTCPADTRTKGVNKDSIKRAYAFQYHKEPIRKNSASGGLFPAFAYYFINNLNGFVCGCVLDENIMPKHIISNNWFDIERMQDSKYVQSDMGGCIQKVGDLLKSGYYVLFTGTSCQIAGLNAFLYKRNIKKENLFTIDFFCHGVSSPLIWKEYIKYYEQQKKSKVVGFRFRNKDYGWGKGRDSRGTGFLSTILYSGIQSPQTGFLKSDKVSFLARIWPRIFFSNLCIRQYCHQCPYTSIDKPADITMGDFWGIEESHPEFDDHKGCSLALVRSSKALELISVLDKAECIEVPLEDVIAKQSNAYKPSIPNPQRNIFWETYNREGFKGVLPLFFGYTYIGRIKAFLKYVFFKLHIIKYRY